MRRSLTCLGILLFMTACQPGLVKGVSCDETTGRLELLHLGKEDVGEAFPYTIEVYLPPCYCEEAERSYPILYLFPGRGSGPTTWFDNGAGEVADRLIAAREIYPLIIVGLENVEGDLMAGNFDEHVQPYVENRYRILPDAKYHAIGGGSMGGAPSYRMALRYPDEFSSIALFGSGIILGEEDRVREWLTAIPKDKLPRVFLNIGLGDVLLIPRAKEFEGIVADYGISAHTIYSDGDHNYQYWVSNFAEYLTWLAEEW